MLFGVLDLARDPTGLIETGLAMYAPDAVCLYREPLREGLRRRAPYLAPLSPDSEFVRFWRDRGRGAAWGVVVNSDLTPDRLRHHLRQFLTVLLPDGQRALFRFYDPRVLPAYLRSCNRQELAEWFAGLTAFRVESRIKGKPVEYTFNGRQLLEQK